MICGQLNLTKDKFDRYYIPLIDEVIKNNMTIYVGNAEGCDTFAVEYLFKVGYENVTVVNKKNEFKFSFTQNKWKLISGFNGYPERDKYMIDHCNKVIGFIGNDKRSLG